jgi:hypothetical protein
LTIGAGQPLVDTLDLIRRKRNRSYYERTDTTSEQEAEEIHAIAMSLERDVAEWMRRSHPDLMGPGD